MVKSVLGVAVCNREGVYHARLRRLGTKKDVGIKSGVPSSLWILFQREQRNRITKVVP
jgi:hypothetical protein